jgi:hypothetical protein
MRVSVSHSNASETVTSLYNDTWAWFILSSFSAAFLMYRFLIPASQLTASASKIMQRCSRKGIIPLSVAADGKMVRYCTAHTLHIYLSELSWKLHNPPIQKL